MNVIYKQLRRAMKSSGKTRYRLWKETGIDQTHLGKILTGKAGLSIESLERLAHALDCELVLRPRNRKEK